MIVRVEVFGGSDVFGELLRQSLTAMNTAIEKNEPLDVEIKAGNGCKASVSVKFDK